MFNKLHSALTSRLASAMLAAVLFAALTAPFVMLQSMHAFAATPPLPCTEGNNNGCTELSSTPPEDLQSVPPNLVLMMDDSGSMVWDYMPDWTSLGTGLPSGWNNSNYGVRNAAINSVYYDPTTKYTPPPKADGTFYPASPGFTKAYKDGFRNPGLQNITSYQATYSPPLGGNPFPYYTTLATTNVTTYPPPVQVCASGFSPDPTNPASCISNNPNPPSVSPVTSTTWKCNSGDGSPNAAHICTHVEGRTTENPVTTTYAATSTTTTACPSGSSLQGDGRCHYPPVPPRGLTWVCPSGGSNTANLTCTTRQNLNYFTYVVGDPASAPGSYVVRYVGAGATCNVILNPAQQSACVNEADSSGASAPTGVTAGQNIANWFSYYRTRMLMAKTGLMEAFISVDPKYRFGFSSINANGVIPASPTPYPFDDSFVNLVSGATGGSSTNKLAVVQPFGDGSTGTQKAKFWTWLAAVSENGGTPLRKALDAVGQYYQTADPWKTLPSDPGYTTGSTTQFTCRAAYTILTTDGFWNGAAPSGIGNAAATDGPVFTVPTGNITQYTAVDPYSGGAVAAGTEPSLADVATYYWENDLNTTLPNEVSASKTDPASWQHMTTFTIGLGFKPTGITPAGTTVPQIFGWANGGAPITGFAWPTPASDSLNNIADLAHAAVNGHGDFFNVNNPADLAAAFSKALADIGARNVPPAAAGVNASVLSVGAMAFLTGYSTGDWTSQFQGVTLKTDGTIDTILWKADALLDGLYHSPTGYASRSVYTNAYKSGTYSSFQLTAATSASLDPVETAGLAPAPPSGNDTLVNRIRFLLGDNTYEGTVFRTRSSILGAILHSDPVYVAGATGSYLDSWPTFGTYTPPEAVTGAQTYAAFVSAEATRAGMVYVGANDGMLHAFNAPVPNCTGTIDVNGDCTAYTFTAFANQGQEAWAFVPRAVYANLGNLTNPTNFQFRPTVDATPVTRDVFFSSDKQWHTLLAGGVGLGGRGVYGLDITNRSTFSAADALWEFDADMPVDSACVANYGTCRGTDMGYTVAQPNVGRLANGHWVVLVPNGYFPDCITPDSPAANTASCQLIAAQAPKDASLNPYSALFVLDAQTGKVIAELKTPATTGVTSFGLSKPVMGDYNSDQVDDVAFAGDVQGNLWRFDLSNTDPSQWAVTLVYKGLSSAGHQGVQPITTMPRLFPDPATNRFMVLFGTGKYLGVGDNSNGVVQSIIAVRDVVGTTYSQSDLTQQFLHESIVPVGQPNAGATLRCITGSATIVDCTTTTAAINPIPSTAGGWYVNLYTTDSGGVQNDMGERVVVNPAAIFSTNTVIFQSLITGAQSTDACNPSTQGAILVFNALTGGSGGVSSLGGSSIVGARIINAHTSGNLPVVSAVGGAKAYIPGVTVPHGSVPPPTNEPPASVDIPNWRRRSWRVLLNDQ